MPLFEQATTNVQGYSDVTPQLVHDTLGQVRLIDVREPGEYNAELGHIPGTDLVPLAGVLGAAASWDRDAELVVVCRSGGRSGRAAQGLVAMGFRRVMNMSGGMLAYNAAGLPVVRP
jgi:sulfur-carrier protein adenylyltransferase/sulfurtransferase